MDTTAFYVLAVTQIDRALTVISITDADKAAFARVMDMDATTAEGKSFFACAVANRVEITPEIWALYLRLLIHNWSEQAQDHAVMLPLLRQWYPSSGDQATNELLDRAIEALESLSWAGYKPQQAAGRPENLMERFFHLAIAVERLGNADTAFNLAALALDLGADQSRIREEVVRYALALAVAAERMHQVAFCSALLASVVAAAADTDTKRQLEAFDCCEIAVERLALAPEDFREQPGRLLMEVILPRKYLGTLLVQLSFFLPQDQRPAELAELSEVLGSEEWPERVSKQLWQNWVAHLKPLWNAQAWDIEIDKARLALEPPPPRSVGAQADWTALTVDHPAYRRAVPHSQSFLTEANFDSLLLELTHEITHIHSILGGVGMALTCLRVASFDTELTLWSNVPGAGDGLEARISKEGVAPVKEGDASSLFRTEQGLELPLKAHILQDVWTPWFEGLAIFGEMAADPVLDPIGIGPVTNCLRNLVDFIPPTNNSGGLLDPERIRASFEEFVAAFDARCSTAIARRGPGRLRAYFRASEVPYLAGYLAVRSVVSAWRVTTGRPITGTNAFALLLHATQHGTFSAVPDLSLQSDLFATAALEMMCDWASRLAQLTSEEIEDFLTPPPRDGNGRAYRWDGPHLIRVTPAEAAMSAPSQSAMVNQRMRQALTSLTRPEDIERLKPHIDDFMLRFHEINIHKLKTTIEEFARRYVEVAERFITLGSLLPVGHVAAKFFANIDTTAPSSYLATQIRTAEAQASNGDPRVNMFWFPIDYASGQQIAASFRRLGSPRLQVTRVIDLTGIAIPALTDRGLHLLAYRYGDWFDIRGATPLIDIVLNSDTDHRAAICDLVRARLYPEPFQRAELDLIARGDSSATRTRDWLDRSKSWSIEDIPVSIETWAEHVRALAERILANEERRPRQIQAARSLIVALLADESLADDLVRKNFGTLTESMPDRREHLVTALFHTAQMPRVDAATTEVVTAFAATSLTIFSTGPHGWDVRAAVRPTP